MVYMGVLSIRLAAPSWGQRHALGTILTYLSLQNHDALSRGQLLLFLPLGIDGVPSAGAEVRRVRPVSITHPDHFVNVARRRAAAEECALFANQFENLANFRAHLKTGDEIWEQLEGRIDAFICGAGTGGTIAGETKKPKRITL